SSRPRRFSYPRGARTCPRTPRSENDSAPYSAAHRSRAKNRALPRRLAKALPGGFDSALRDPSPRPPGARRGPDRPSSGRRGSRARGIPRKASLLARAPHVELRQRDELHLAGPLDDQELAVLAGGIHRRVRRLPRNEVALERAQGGGPVRIHLTNLQLAAKADHVVVGFGMEMPGNAFSRSERLVDHPHVGGLHHDPARLDVV